MARKAGDSFAALGVMTTLCGNLRKVRIGKPTNIQQLSIPSLLANDKHHVLYATQGKGKTLSYLLPVLHRLRIRSILAGSKSTNTSPGALVLVQSYTHAQHVAFLLKALAQDMHLRTATFQSQEAVKTITQKVNEGVDLMVAGVDLAALAELDWKFTREMVIDDADLTLREQRVSEFVKSSIPTSRLILTASNKGKTESYIQATFPSDGKTPEIVRIEEEKLYGDLSVIKHAILPTTTHSRDSDFLSAMDKRREEIKQKKSIVFCNSLQRVKAIESLLREHNYTAVPLHSDLSAKTKARNMWKVTRSLCKVLVVNDISAREEELPNAKIVVSADFPTSASDYAFRANLAIKNSGAFICLMDEGEKKLYAEYQRAFELSKPKHFPPLLTQSA